MVLHDGPMSEDTTEDFAAVLDSAMRRTSMTTAELRRRLAARGTPISEGALRFWRSGQRRPEHGRSLEVLEHLEDLLGLDGGELVQRLGPSRRKRRSRDGEYDELVGLPGTLEPVIEAAGCTGLAELEIIGGSIVIDIGTDRRVLATSNRALMRSRVDGATRMRVILGLDAPTAVAPTIEVVGADVRRSAYDPASGWAVWEVVLPRSLSVGETSMVEWRLPSAPEEADPDNYEYVAERRMEEVSMWLRFEGDTPARIEVFEESDEHSARRVVRPTGATVQHTVRNFGPGVLGIRWQW